MISDIGGDENREIIFCADDDDEYRIYRNICINLVIER